MSPPLPPLDSALRTLDDHVEAFEKALAEDSPVDLEPFLPPPGHPLRDTVLTELLRIDLETAWTRGRPRPLAAYLLKFPAFFADPEHLGAVAFEEYRQRRQAGENPSPSEYQRDYGIDTAGWPPQKADDDSPRSLVKAARAYRSYRRGAADDSVDLVSWLESRAADAPHARFFSALHQSDPEAADRLAAGLIRMPEVGTEFLGFNLLAELGRGAFGRVYLAEQKELANRLVALKVAPDLGVGGESQTLARLQHTHIVPIYSWHRDGPLHAVVMPYFGSLTLAHILSEVASRPSLPQSGAELMSSLSSRSAALRPLPPCDRKDPSQPPPVGPGVMSEAARRNMEGKSYVEAVLWVGARLAEGLAHAHERGIFHRDLKPANVLVTDDCQPMLLDFNLSSDSRRPAEAARALVGGTLAYMAPEHLEAFGGRRMVVDGRSDLFALGILLYELLTGRHPYPYQPDGRETPEALADRLSVQRRLPPVQVSRHNSAVTPAVVSILGRCLEPDPARRYQSARHLQEDLDRQLASQPLLHAPDPSLRERLRKRLKRSPRLLPTLVIVALLLGVLAAMGFGVKANIDRRREQEHARWLQARQDAVAALEATQKEMMEVRFLLGTRTEHGFREQGMALGHRLLDRYGALEDWDRGPLVTPLVKKERESLQSELGELLVALARNQEQAGQGRGDAPADSKRLRDALLLNERAERLFPGDSVPPTVWLQRDRLYQALGDAQRAAQWRQRGEAQRRRTARDYYLLAGDMAPARKYREMLPLLMRATRQDPQSHWAHFLLGNCHDGLGDDVASVAAYDVCVALAPAFYGSYYNRGLAHYRQKRYTLALDDLDDSIRLRPDFQPAYTDRALVLQGLNRFNDAVADLTRALELDGTETRLYFLRSAVRERARDTDGAKQDFDEGLRRDPRDEKSWVARGMARLRKNEPLKALADFESGLAAHPNSRALLNNKVHVLSEHLHRPKDALPVLNEVIRLYPEYTTAINGRGVLHARLGNREAALADAREVLRRTNDPDQVFQVGCTYALTSQTHPDDARLAFVYLFDAVRRGFGADLVETDADLKPLHGRPDFRELTELTRRLRAAQKRAAAR